MAYAVYLGCDRGCTLDREDWGCCDADASSKTGSREPTRFEGPFGEYRTQAPGRAPPPCAPTGPTSSRGRPARRASGVRACPRCARPPRAAVACPWTALARASSSCRVRRGRSRLPRPRPTARRRRSGLAMASRRRPGMRVAAFSETLTGTASSRANTLPPTSPAATWHGTGGAGAPRSAAWPSRSSQRGGGSTLSSGSSPSAQCHPPACSCGIGRCQRVSHSRMPNTDTPSSTNAPSPSYTTLSVAFSRPGIRPTVLRFRVNELR